MFDFHEEQKRIFGSNDRKLIIKEYLRFAREQPDGEDWRSYVKTEFPYYSPESTRPSPLPTIKEIEAAYLTTNDISQNLPNNTQVSRVREYAVKTCTSPTILQEAENLLFLEKHCPTLKTPKVYAAYDHKGGDPVGALARFSHKFPGRSHLPSFYYLVTEYIPGNSCYKETWEALSHKAKETVIHKLAEQIQLLRQVPAPQPAYYGRVHHQGWYPCLNIISQSGDPREFRGPYDSHDALMNTILQNALTRTCSQIRDHFTDGEKLYLDSFLDVMSRASGREPVLSHFDLQLHNVIVLENPDDPDDPDISIIDWLNMGWMPAYMETAHAWTAIGVNGWAETFLLHLHKELRPSHLDAAGYFSKFLSEFHIDC